ncbi:hypothetical protein M514_03552, partial [Trichuris suis]
QKSNERQCIANKFKVKSEKCQRSVRGRLIYQFAHASTTGVPRVPFLKNSLNLAIMCTTNRTLDSFDGYGCWCKQKGHVGEPVDDIDNCCKYHETSVQKLLQTAYCNSFDSFVFPYSAFCAKTKDGNKPTCLSN